MEIVDLLAKIKADLAGVKEPEYLQPTRTCRYFEYLTTSPDRKVVIINLYYSWIKENGFPLDARTDSLVILHGHDEDKGCAAPYFCHELGYKPTGGESPAFLKQWSMTWKNFQTT